METSVENKADGNAVWYSMAPPASLKKIKK